MHVSDFECKANVITLECKANTITPSRVVTHLFVDDLPSPETPACGDEGRGVERWRDVGGRVVCGGRCDGGQR